MILQAIQKSLNDHQLNDTPIYIACSGGRDSMALLYACILLKLPICVLHINHKLQKISDEWQILVEDFCNQYQIVCKVKQLHWQQPINSINEAKARQARYQAFCELTESVSNDLINNYPLIATAHHANDQAETVLMNLAQGTGLAGLSGIKALTVQREFDKPLRLWRPLLHISRDEIDKFIVNYQIPFVDDPTNFGNDNQRAFLRNHLLPLLHLKFNKAIENISRSCQNIDETRQIMEEIIAQDLIHCQMPQGLQLTEKRININVLKNYSQPRIFQILHYWLKGERKFAPNRQIIEQIYQLIFTKNTEQQTIIVWQTVQIRRYRDVLYRLEQDYWQDCKNQQNFVKLSKDFTICEILPNQSLQLLWQKHHQSFKKICQNLQVPVWQRQFCYVVERKGVPIAICFVDKCLFLANFY